MLDHHAHQFVGLLSKANAFSRLNAVFNNNGSCQLSPISCTPNGSPSSSNPTGKLIAGRPARFVGTVNMSFMYISTGSCVPFEPKGNAEVGVVGVNIKSTFLNTSSKSFLIRLLTF